jgi:hypothetical protein
MGFDVAEMERSSAKALTPLHAHSRCLPMGGKNTECRSKRIVPFLQLAHVERQRNSALKTAIREMLFVKV